jgi:hypothetical protein
MLRFQTGGGPVHAIAVDPGGRLVVDYSSSATAVRPAPNDRRRGSRDLLWWDPAAAAVVRRFRLWDTLMGPRGALRGTPHEGHGYEEDDPPLAASYCPRTDRVAVAWSWHSIEDPVVVYDLAADAVEAFGFWARVYIRGVAFAPGGGRIAQAVTYQKTDAHALRVWPADDGGRFGDGWDGGGPSVAVPGEATALAFDGRYAAAKVEEYENGEQTEDGAYLWDSADPGAGPARELAPGFTPRQFAFAAAAPVLAVGGQGLAVWDLHHARWVASGDPPAEVRSLAFDPAGRRLAVGLGDGTLELRDRECRPGCRLETCAGGVTAVTFAPDGLTCAAGGEDGQVVIWDVEA